MLEAFTNEPHVPLMPFADEKPVTPALYEDPLGEDLPSDRMRWISDRQLVRLVVVSAQVATRFEEERLSIDPVAWMLTPRRLFEGQAAIDACHELPAFVRAVILHGLAIGLDADPQWISDLTAKRGSKSESLRATQ